MLLERSLRRFLRLHPFKKESKRLVAAFEWTTSKTAMPRSVTISNLLRFPFVLGLEISDVA